MLDSWICSHTSVQIALKLQEVPHMWAWRMLRRVKDTGIWLMCYILACLLTGGIWKCRSLRWPFICAFHWVIKIKVGSWIDGVCGIHTPCLFCCWFVPLCWFLAFRLCLMNLDVRLDHFFLHVLVTYVYNYNNCWVY